jgi:hypothetical protein
LFSIFDQNKRGKRVVGLDLFADGYALAVLEPSRSAPRVISARWCELDDTVGLRDSLRD